MNTLAPVDAVAILLTAAAVLGYINIRWLRLPPSIGMTLMGAIASLLVVALDHAFAQNRLSVGLGELLTRLDLHQTLFGGVLSFLLFAGALHVDLNALRANRWSVLLFSTVGVAISTAIVGFGFHAVVGLLGIDLPLAWCLVFGALISPTDPVSVMAVMKRAAMPAPLQATVAGESLFNDGAGVVVFTMLLGIASSGGELHFGEASLEFLREVGGGLVFGLVAGMIAFMAMRSIDDYGAEIAITIALALGGYRLAHAMGVSAPIAMAVAGLIIGNFGVSHAMSEVTRRHLLAFWSLVDDLLNALLFLLIGLELFAIAPGGWLAIAGLLAIPLCLAARAVSVGVPLLVTRRLFPLGDLAYPTLVWGGLRGGISVALALSLPEGPMKAPILSATYIVGMFSVIIQGGTISTLLERLTRRKVAGSA